MAALLPLVGRALGPPYPTSGGAFAAAGVGLWTAAAALSVNLLGLLPVPVLDGREVLEMGGTAGTDVGGAGGGLAVAGVGIGVDGVGAGAPAGADRTEAVVDYHAEAREGGHVVDVAARSEPGGVLQVELTVADGGGTVVGEGALRLSPAALPPTERLLAQVLRGLTQLHGVPEPAVRGDQVRRARPNARRPWSDEEEDRLRAAWDAAQPVARIAAAHGRTTNAIQSRLLKLGLITLDHPQSPAGRFEPPHRDRTGD
jgi:hypothetical protein